MRPFTLTAIKTGISRLRTKGGARPDALYDLVNGKFNSAREIEPRPGSLIFEDIKQSVTVELLAVGCLSNTSFVFLYPYKDAAEIPVDSQPASVGRGVSWAPGGSHLIAPHDAAPFFSIYRRDQDGLVKLPALPFSGNSDIGWCGAWTADGTRLAVGMRGNTTTFPFVAVFSRSGDTFAPVAEIFDAAATTLKRVQSMAYHEDGAVLATVSNQAEGLSLYDATGDAYTKITPLSVSFPGTGVMCAFSGDYLAVTTSTLAANAPLKVCKLIAGPDLQEIFSNTTDDFGGALAWSRDGQYLAAILSASTGRPVMRVYQRAGDVLSLAASKFLTNDGTDTGSSLDPQDVEFNSSHVMVSVNVGNKVLAFEIGTFDSDVSAEVTLPATSDGPAQFSLSCEAATDVGSIEAGKTFGLAYFRDLYHVFSSEHFEIVSSNVVLHVLKHPDGVTEMVAVHLAEPFLGYLFVVAEYANGDVHYFWLTEGSSGGEAWQADHIYKQGTIVRPTVPNGLYYRAERLTPPGVVWAPGVPRAEGDVVEPTEYNGFEYEAIEVSGTDPRSGTTEPDWIAEDGAIVYEDVDSASNSQGGGDGGNRVPPDVGDRYDQFGIDTRPPTQAE